MSSSRAQLQVKVSALKAGMSAATILLTGAAMLLVRVLMDRVFDGRWASINWLISIKIIGTISGLWFVVLFGSNLLELRTSDSREEAHNPSFPATVLIRLIYSANIGMSAVLFWGLRDGPVWLRWLSLSFGLLAFFAWPRTITLGETGISQRSLIGIRRTIPYSEVEYISYQADNDTTDVVGPNTAIKHRSEHSDTALFHALLEERTGKEVRY